MQRARATVSRAATGPASARQRDQLAANILPDEQDRIVRKI
jgi:hypothetical protein